MSESKEEQALSLDITNSEVHLMNFSQDYPKDTRHYLSTQDAVNLVYTSKRNYVFYKPILDNRIETKLALTYVVQGKIALFLDLIKQNPSLFFEKYPEIIGPKGQRYFDVSTYMLIQFLCDRDMKEKAMSLIPKDFDAIRNEQYAKMGCGGPDLVKLDRNPEKIVDFKDLMEFKQTYTLFDGNQEEVTFSLLENPDGIIFYQGQFYYANKEKHEIKLLTSTLSPEDEKEFEQFKASFEGMENNSSRRSSDKEYQLIAKLLQCSLVRQGIQYEQDGIRYRDSQAPFNNLLNAYRTSIRFYLKAEQGNNNRALWDTADEFWCKNLGTAQAQSPIWVLQRFCEKNKPFYLFSDKHLGDFIRCDELYNYSSGKYEPILVDGVIVAGLGSIVALYKATAMWAVPWGAWGADVRGMNGVDLGAVSRLVGDAKANMIEFKQEPETNYRNC